MADKQIVFELASKPILEAALLNYKALIERRIGAEKFESVRMAQRVMSSRVAELLAKLELL